MKKYSFYILLLFTIFSCSKSHNSPPVVTPPPTGKNYKVTFNVSASSNQVNAIKGKTIDGMKQTDSVTNIGGFTTHLEYYVYNSTGTLVTTLIQDSTASNYGQITDTFTAGNYSIIIIASEGPVLINTVNNYVYPNGHDTFCKIFPLNVSNNTATTQNVNLDREVGQLQVKILDAIPSNVASLEFQVTNDNEIYFNLSNESIGHGGSYVLSPKVILPDSVKGTTNYTLTTYIGNTVSPFTVNIYAYDSAGKQVATSVVTDVTCEVNTRTILSGNLFESSASAFTISFNNTLAPDPIVIHF